MAHILERVKVGDVFSRLTTLEWEKRVQGNARPIKFTYWLCQCECGKKKWVREDALRVGRIRSCGCYRRDATAERMTSDVGKSMAYLANFRRNPNIRRPTVSDKLPEDEIAHRRLMLAFVEMGACVTDMGNLLLQKENPSKMKRGGVVLGLQRVMLAVQNRSFADIQRDPQLQATEFGSNHVYMDPILDLLGLLAEFLPYVPDTTPFKAQVTEMIGRIDPRTQVEVEQINGIAIRSHVVCSFTYRNWKGEVEQRRVRPMKFYYGTTEWYPDPGWLLHALDLEKDQTRDFSTRNMVDVVFS